MHKHCRLILIIAITLLCYYYSRSRQLLNFQHNILLYYFCNLCYCLGVIKQLSVVQGYQCKNQIQWFLHQLGLLNVSE